MEIRKIRQEDIETIVDLVKRNYEIMLNVHSKEVIRKFETHNTLDNWQKQMTWKEIFVVEDNQGIVATGALANFGNSDSPKYCISNFFVHVENQNTGVGKQLLNYILKVAKSRGIDALHVPSSRSGLEFYKRMGFSVDDLQTDVLDEITWMTMNIG